MAKTVKSTKKKVDNKKTNTNKKIVKEEKKVEVKKEEIKKKEVVKEEKKDRGLLFAIIGIIVVIVLALVSILVPEREKTDDSKVLAIMTIENYGDILLELDRDAAPITVDNFLDLANSGYYDGSTFHRVVKDFMIQGGSYKGDIENASTKTIKGEFEANGVKNDISHVRGTISMARGEDPDSGSDQFFITNVDFTDLDGYYAAFGHVISGMDIVDKITEDVGTADQMEYVEEDKRPIITSIREVKSADSTIEE